MDANAADFEISRDPHSSWNCGRQNCKIKTSLPWYVMSNCNIVDHNVERKGITSHTLFLC